MALDFRVRVAWATDPFAVTPTWTDVSQYVDVGSSSINITRGTGDLDDSVNPSTLSLTFDNHDGRFTPGYTGGAYYPNVALRKRIQVHETTNGVLFNPRFDGYLDTLPMQWAPTGRYAEAQVTAVDRLKILGKQQLTDNIVSLYYQADAPAEYWDLGDAEGTVHPRNRTGVTILSSDTALYTTTSAVTYGNGTGVGTDGLSAVQVLNSRLVAGGSPAYNLASGSTFTVEGFVRLNNGDTGTVYDVMTLVTLGSTAGSTVFFHLSVQDTAQLSYDGGLTLVGTSHLCDGRTHHVACTYDGTTHRLYVDGVQEAAFASGIFGWGSDSRIATVANAANAFPAPDATLTASHVAFYTSALSAAEILDHANSGLTGFVGETSAARFTRVAALAGITPVVTGTSGTQTMGPLKDVEGTTLLDQLQAIQDTENGAFFVQADGDLQLVPRTAFYNQAAAMTLSTGQYGQDLTFLADDTGLINDATVTDANGVVQRVTNATSITANGTYSASKTLNTTDSNEALSWAQWQVNAVSTLTARVSQVTVDLLTQQSLIPTAMALDIGNRLDLTGLPTGAPASSVQLQIAGYTESYSLAGYTITFNTVPFLTGNVFTFNDVILGRFNTGGVFAY